MLLNDTLVFNTALFYSDIDNYQQQVRIVDEYTTALNIANGVTPATAYTSATGNVPKVKVKGMEIDGVYAGIKNTTLRFSGAYNDAYYADFPNLAQPVENGYPGRRRIAMPAARTCRARSSRSSTSASTGACPSPRRSSSTPAATSLGRTSSTAMSRCPLRVDSGRAIVDLSLGVGSAAAAST